MIDGWESPLNGTKRVGGGRLGEGHLNRVVYRYGSSWLAIQRLLVSLASWPVDGPGMSMQANPPETCQGWEWNSGFAPHRNDLLKPAVSPYVVHLRWRRDLFYSS